MADMVFLGVVCASFGLILAFLRGCAAIVAHVDDPSRPTAAPLDDVSVAS